MSKVAKTIGKIAGVVAGIALIGSGIGSALGGTMVFSALGVTASAASIATYAGLVSGFAGLLAQATAKRPTPQAAGSINQITIAPNAPTPCIIGETYFAGTLRHDVGYGGKVDDVDNPYRGMVIDYSGCGPVQSLVGIYADFQPVSVSGNAATGYYAGFLYRDYQLGARPESDALAPNWAGMTNWTTSHKLSGKAAILWNLKFDKNGKIFASGLPQLGAVWRGVKAYDPRADSTYPGGSGSQRIDDETTWAYSTNPAVQALTYAIGRHYAGRKIFGIGLAADAIDIAAFVAWANVCDANGWTCGGIIFEPDVRWDNLKRIMAAGSAEPLFVGGVLSVRYDAPRVSLVTITADDLADGPVRVRAMKSWRERINTVIPKYRSSAHKWEYVEAAAISDAGYLAEDGEEKIETYQVDLCQNVNQAAELAAYRLVNGRELGAIELSLKPEFRFYRPGDMVTIDIDEAGLAGQDCVIVQRSIDPQTLAVRFVLVSETTAKHDFALGLTGTAPPTPTLTTAEDRDTTAGTNLLGGVSQRRIYQRSALQPTTPADSSGTPAGWYDHVADVPASSDPLWASDGLRPDILSDYGWDEAIRLEGQDGAPGVDGADGVTYYTHYAYADAPDGSFNFTTGSPGDRTYQGVRYDQTSATESTDPADYAWSPYVGPPNFGLAAFDSNTVVAGNKLIKVAGATDWDGSIHSTESFKGGASVSFVVDLAAQFMLGLNTDPTSDASYSSIDFAIYVNGADVEIYESGVPKTAMGIVPVPGDVFSITYNNKTVVYSKNGTPFFTNSSPAADLTLFLDSSMVYPGVQVGRILSFTAAGPAGTDGADGSDGADGADGTDGLPGLTISASPPVATVARTAGGLAKSGELPKSIQVQVLDGDTDVTASCSFSKADTGSTWSNDGGGAFTLTSISAEEAYTVITATYGSRDPVPIKISVAQPKDGSAASRATASVTSMNASGTYTAIATVDIVAAAGATISGNASTTYLAASFVGTGTRTVRQQAKVSIQNLTDGGAEVDGAAQIGSAASYIGGDGPSDIGQVSASNYVTNSSGAPKTFRLKFYIRKYDGATNVQTAGGTYSGNIEAQVA
ncbi:MAG: phage tail protein [Sphingopyxis sp.]